ncbi:hypothetical protein [Krasilnikovia sp. MM14-A1259]|uniref:hypothetical protein n=1 Tax=Krasilnikovia sp. MM14-A1259 TaxID=3373539 RepID=UPI00380CE6BD
MPATAAARIAIETVTAAVKSVAATCTAPTLVTLTAAGVTVTGRRETTPGGALTADNAAATLRDMAELIARHPALFDPAVFGYALILPGERIAFAADRTGVTHSIQLPGAPTEPLRVDRWGAVSDALTAMITAAVR